MKKYKPTTPSRRGMSGIEYRKVLSGDKPEKKLTRGFRRGSGRNAFGRITQRHKGGGVKRRYRDVDFSNGEIGVPARVCTIEYDPNRSGFIALIAYKNGKKSYILAPKSLAVGDIIVASEDAPIATGNRTVLSRIPVGTFVYNVEIKPHGGAKIARSAGISAEVVALDNEYAHVKMPSSEVRRVSSRAWAAIGAVSNDEHHLVVIGKAGRTRKKGIRPTVRGSAMNPVDHPYGGGEGRQGRGIRRAKNVYGKPVGIGQKTRRPKKYSNTFIVSRRKVGKQR